MAASVYAQKAVSDVFLRGVHNSFNPVSANPTKWSNTPKQFFGKLPTNCLSVFDHFVKLALKGLRRRPGRFLNLLYTFNLRSVFRGYAYKTLMSSVHLPVIKITGVN